MRHSRLTFPSSVWLGSQTIPHFTPCLSSFLFLTYIQDKLVYFHWLRRFSRLLVISIDTGIMTIHIEVDNPVS